MRWYVSREGEVVGPIEPAELIEWVRTRPAEQKVGLFVRDEASAGWAPIEQSPFASAADVRTPQAFAPVQGGSDALGYAILLAPFISGLLVWLWIANMNLLQDPSGTLSVLTIITVGGTALLMAVEASQLGMGKQLDSRGKKGSSPIAWFFVGCLLWFIAFPWYLDQRRYYSRKPLAVGGILVMLFFLGSSAVVGAAIENRKAEIRKSLGDAEASLANLRSSVPAPTVDYSAEIARFASARQKLKNARPKTEAELVQTLGEPTNTMQAGTMKVLSWYFETKEFGRDVVTATISGAGVVMAMNY